MLEETAKIEAYISEHCGRHIRAAYGCSLGGSFVGLLAARRNIHMDYGILGSSDLDQTSPLAAKLQTNLLLPLLYPVIRDGKIKSRLLQKRLEKRKSEMGGYVQAFMEMLGGARLYVTMQSCKNQFYSDLVTRCQTRSTFREQRFIFSTPSKWVKNTVRAMNSILPAR